jgi:hypothetical protein
MNSTDWLAKWMIESFLFPPNRSPLPLKLLITQRVVLSVLLLSLASVALREKPPKVPQRKVTNERYEAKNSKRKKSSLLGCRLLRIQEFAYQGPRTGI